MVGNRNFSERFEEHKGNFIDFAKLFRADQHNDGVRG